MSKPKSPPRRAENEARAVLRLLRVSPRKLNLVAGLIRGMRVERALAELEFSHRRIARDVRKVLASAIANAEFNHKLNVDALVVAEAFVGKNLVMKRMNPRARGRGARIEKPFSQITIILRETADKPKARAIRRGIRVEAA